MVENAQVDALLQIDNLEEFNYNFKLFKNSITDLYSATNNFMKNLITNIETSLIEKVKLVK